MLIKWNGLVGFLILALVLTACGSAGANSNTMENTAAEEMMEATAADDGMMETESPDEMMADEPAWLSTSLTDVNSGSAFTLNDYKGKVVLVETMAVWCTTCKRQQGEMQQLIENLGMPANLVTVSLDVDFNEDDALLKDYQAGSGFDWIFAVAPKDVAREIAQLYGDQYLNPPSTPILVIDADGKVHTLPFGVKSAADLQKQLEPFLQDAM